MRRTALLLILGACGCQSPPSVVTIHANIVTVHPVVSHTTVSLKVEK